MKTFEVTYYINMHDDVDEDYVLHILMYKPHYKKMIKIKEIPFVDLKTIQSLD